MAFHHISVLLHESIELLRVDPEGIYVDGTLGGGGHAALICGMLGETGTLGPRGSLRGGRAAHTVPMPKTFVSSKLFSGQDGFAGFADCGN